MLEERLAKASKGSWAQGREWLVMALAGALFVLAAFGFTVWYMGPNPPKVVTISTGGEAGGYFAFGKRYAEILARSGIKLEVKSSAGSVENLTRLQDPKSGVSVALLQGGIGNSKDAAGISSIGRVFHEPLWIFYRGDTVDRLSQLKGKRIGIGPEGSGTRLLSATLLKANDVAADNSTLSPLGSQPAVDALNSGQLDAVFLALAPQAPLIQQLLRSTEIKLMSVAQADAYTKTFPYLAKLTLPQGVIDLVANIPAKDVTLLAPTAALVVRDDLHKAIAALLAEAAQEVHGKTSLFSKAGEFPTQHDPDFEMDADAVRFYKSGPTFFKRILPFNLANLAERLIVFLVPLLTVLYPASKAIPAIYKWRVRQGLLKRYKAMKSIEARFLALPPGANTAGLLHEADELELAVAKMKVPTNFSEMYFDMREHLRYVRERLASASAAT